jgi:hypothetical protein
VWVKNFKIPDARVQDNAPFMPFYERRILPG